MEILPLRFPRTICFDHGGSPISRLADAVARTEDRLGALSPKDLHMVRLSARADAAELVLARASAARADHDLRLGAAETVWMVAVSDWASSTLAERVVCWQALAETVDP